MGLSVEQGQMQKMGKHNNNITHLLQSPTVGKREFCQKEPVLLLGKATELKSYIPVSRGEGQGIHSKIQRSAL